jgi:hypothetical protein
VQGPSANGRTWGEPFLLRHPWGAAALFGTTATPAAVILAVPAPRPLDAILAWPLVLIDSVIGQGPNLGTTAHPMYEGTPLLVVIGLLAGIVLTWAHYILLARLILWRVAVRAGTPGGMR